MTQKMTLSMWTPHEYRLQRQFKEFLSNEDVLSRIHSGSFRIATYEKLLLYSKHFCRAAISAELLVWRNSFESATSSEQLLLWSSYFSRTLTSPQQLFFQNSYLFGANFVPTSYYFLRIGSFLGQLVFQNSYYLRRHICSDIDTYRRVSFSKQTFLQNIGIFRIAAFSTNVLPTFWNSRFFGKAIERNICFFRRATFSEQLLFSM